MFTPLTFIMIQLPAKNKEYFLTFCYDFNLSDIVFFKQTDATRTVKFESNLDLFNVGFSKFLIDYLENYNEITDYYLNLDSSNICCIIVKNSVNSFKNNEIILDIDKVISINALLLLSMVKKSKYEISIENIEEKGKFINYTDLPSLFRIELNEWLHILKEYDYDVGPQNETVDFTNLIS